MPTPDFNDMQIKSEQLYCTKSYPANLKDLSKHEQQKITLKSSNHVCCFDDGRKTTATENEVSLAKIRKRCTDVRSDLLDSEIPLLFSR